MSDPNQVMKAWFTKKAGKGGIMAKSKKRWFVMDALTINYYEKEDLKNCKGTISVPSIKEVKTNSRNLSLITEYRTFSLTAETVEVCIVWAEAVEKRKKNAEERAKEPVKPTQIIQKTVSVEGSTKELCEYIEMLEMENKELRSENERMRDELNQRKGK